MFVSFFLCLSLTRCLRTDYGLLGVEEVIPVTGLRKPLKRKSVVNHLQKHGWWAAIRAEKQLLTGSHVTPLVSVAGLSGRVEKRKAGEWSCACCKHSMVIPMEAPAPPAPPVGPIRKYCLLLAVVSTTL